MSDQVITPFARAAPSIPDYELLRPIGRGAYGEVWLARNVTGSWVALKIVHRSAFDHDRPFEREFEGIKRFEPISRSDPSQVAILHVGLGDGFFYYVMELADDVAAEVTRLNAKSETRNPKSEIDQSLSINLKVGRVTPCAPQLATDPTNGAHGVTRPTNPATYQPKTLKRLLNDRGALPAQECLTITLSLTRALANLHGHGLVHRDVKPSNVIFVNGQAKLADIGLVTSVDATRSFVGTEGYLPPEGAGTPQADLYSLGKVLYEMSTGCDRKEFPALPPDIATRPDRDALAELNAIIVRACQLDPQQRYTSAEEMHGELALVQRGQSVRRKRAVQHRFSVAKRIALAVIVLALLITALIFLKGFKLEHSPNPEAMREYQLGRWYYNQCTLQAHQKALEHLNRAVELDPKFVKPYGELTAICVWGRLGLFASDEAKFRMTKGIADTLLALDPTLAEGHAALSWCHFMQQDWRGADDEIARAIKLNPNYPIARDMYVFYLSLQGRSDEAQLQAQRSQELDPTARTSGLVAAFPFYAARQFDKAIAQLQRVIELDKNFPEAHNLLGKCYEAQSNYIAAIEEYRTYDLLEGRDQARVTAGYAALREAYDTAGREGYLRKFIELIREDESLPEGQKIFFVGDIAACFAELGENEKALDELEKNSNTDHQLKFEPWFDALHEVPRFKALLKRSGLEP